MVRLKHRYLLVNILYPDSAQQTSGVRPEAKDVPDLIDFNQPSSDKLTPQLLARIVRDGVAELFGDYGSGMIAGSLVGMSSASSALLRYCLGGGENCFADQRCGGWFTVKYLSPATSTAIIRVSRDHYRLVWAALSFVTKLPRPVDQSCVFKVVRVSGTIRKAEEEAIRRAKASILRAQRSKGGAGDTLGRMLGEETKDVEMGGIMDDEDDDDEDED